MSSDEDTVEVQEILDRCKECGTAVRVLVFESWALPDGSRAASLRGEQVPHTRGDCAAMKALEREQWPTLF
jgi:hypothetical protein